MLFRFQAVKKYIKSRRDIALLDYMIFCFLLLLLFLFGRIAFHYTDSYTLLIADGAVSAFLFTLRAGYVLDPQGNCLKKYFAVLFIPFGKWKALPPAVHLELSGKLRRLGAEDAFGTYMNEDLIARFYIRIVTKSGAKQVIYETRHMEALYKTAVRLGRLYTLHICDMTKRNVRWIDPQKVQMD